MTLATGHVPEFAARWGARGHVAHLDGPVHWIDFGNIDFGNGAAPAPGPSGAPPAAQDGALVGAPDGAPPLVFVHGLGGSHLNWALIGPQLATGRRAVAVDLRGFGLTPGTGATATVQANAALLDRFLREVAGTPAILVGNSMGGMISILQAHAHPDTVAGLVLISPALPLPRQQVPDLAVGRRFLAYALPGLGEWYMRLVQVRVPPRVAVQRVTELCFADPSRADPAMVAASVALAEYRQSVPGGAQSLLAAARSLMRVAAQRQRYEAMMAAIGVPVLLLGGEADRLVPAASVRRAARLNPGWDSHVWAGVGHTSQLETPEQVTAAIGDWLARRHLLTAN